MALATVVHNLHILMPKELGQSKSDGRKTIYHIGRKDPTNQEEADRYFVDEGGGSLILQLTIISSGEFAQSHIEEINRAVETLKRDRSQLASSSLY